MLRHNQPATIYYLVLKKVYEKIKKSKFAFIVPSILAATTRIQVKRSSYGNLQVYLPHSWTLASIFMVMTISLISPSTLKVIIRGNFSYPTITWLRRTGRLDWMRFCCRITVRGCLCAGRFDWLHLHVPFEFVLHPFFIYTIVAEIDNYDACDYKYTQTRRQT